MRYLDYYNGGPYFTRRGSWCGPVCGYIDAIGGAMWWGRTWRAWR